VSRRVVVTGGATGIGRAVVKAFVALDDEVHALGRDEDALRRIGQSAGALTAVCDVTDEEAVRRTFGRIGDVDVLVNNAGFAESAPIGKTTLRSWCEHFDVNVTGPFLCTRAVVDGMRARGAGSIITIASTAGRVGAPYTSAYTASKHAAVGLMRAVAAELAGSGVRVNAVCPTFVRTPMTARSIARIVEQTGRTPEQAEQALAGQTPLGRLLEPDEVAAAVVFLASEPAAAITGQAIVIDGGGIQI
jgi:NAD(P)-dependent dehydrogenase (short-subunit alcohol dehydrogenase family)